MPFTDDKVVNIRLRLCSILPQVKSVIKLPPDRQLIQELESRIRQLMVNEVDKDVSDAVQTVRRHLLSFRLKQCILANSSVCFFKAIVELDKIEVMVESVSAFLLVCLSEGGQI